MNNRIIITTLLPGLFALFVSIDALAQEESTATQAAEAQTASAEPAVADPPPKMSKMDKLRMKIRNLGNDDEPCEENCESTEDSLAVPGGPGIRDHTCESGNCSCAGAKDCVAMKKICAPNTLTCNDYGCTCAEKPDDGGDGG